MINLRNTLFMSASTMILAGSVNALDLTDPPLPLHTNTLELEPILMPESSYNVTGVTFLGGDASYDRGFGNYRDVGRNYNTGNCGDSSSLFNNKNCSYPKALVQSSRCPFKPGYYRECVCLPQFKIATCPAPKFKSSPSCDGLSERCLCPPTIPLAGPSEKCTQYCDGNCISKSCTPLTNETGCQYGTETASDNCGGTRTVCKTCNLPTCTNVSTKPANSSYTTASCTDCSGTKTINTGWSCNSGYYKSGNACIKSCSLSPCLSLASKPENSSFTTSSCTDCSGTKTINNGWTCDSGFYKSGTSCVKDCTLPTCTSITSKPENSSYTTTSCTDCSGTKTINSGWTCNSGYYKSGTSCVKDCTLPACSGITAKPENSSYITTSCTDCSGTKTINSGWSCNSGYSKSGSNCVKDCALPACSGITTKPENSSFTTSSCTDCSGTKTINSGWTCNSGYIKSGTTCVQEEPSPSPSPSESELPCSLPACSSITTKPANSSYKTSSCTDCSGTKTINSGWTCNSGYYKSGTTCVQDEPSPSPSPSESESPSSTPTPSVPYTQAECNSRYGTPQSDGKCSAEYDGSHWTGSTNGCPRDEDCDCTFPSYVAHPECEQYYSGAKCKLTVGYPMQGHSGC